MAWQSLSALAFTLSTTSFGKRIEYMVYSILERQFQINLLIYQYRVTVKSCIDKFKKKVQNGSTLIEAV